MISKIRSLLFKLGKSTEDIEKEISWLRHLNLKELKEHYERIKYSEI